MTIDDMKKLVKDADTLLKKHSMADRATREAMDRLVYVVSTSCRSLLPARMNGK